jgi:TldD protein
VKQSIRLPIAVIALLAALCGTLGAQQATQSPVMRAMKQELARSMQILHEQPVPPYFLSYEITEVRNVAVGGSFGTLTHSSESHHRLLDIDLRVGDYKLDNTHEIRGGNPYAAFFDRYTSIELPIEDDPDTLRSVLWYQTDKKYKRAAEQFTKVGTNVQVKVAEEDKSADFSREPAEKFSEPVVPVNADRRVWEEKIRKYTAPFAKYGDIYEGSAYLSVSGETRWFVNSEGSEIQTSQPSYRLMIYAFTKAEDGMELPRYESFLAFTPEGLPDDAKVLAVVDKIIADLHALKKAPVVDPFIGPAIMSGRASAVFFHEVFGHRIEGHRQKSVREAQTFKKKINEKVLPDNFSVIFDPTVRRLAGTDLAGYFRYDNQGVKARRVTVIENGVFKNFLMSRTPIEGFANSNGHGRNQAGFAPVSRQSNLIVEVAHPVSHARLREMLIEEMKKQNKPFGLLFDDISGGFTMTGRTIPNAFNVMPLMVYRVYPDGREELVRGVDFIGTPLNAFSNIVAGDDQLAVFNGVCGAESGGVPVGAVSPSVLISQIEVQKKEKSQERAPILPAAFEEKN